MSEADASRFYTIERGLEEQGDGIWEEVSRRVFKPRCVAGLFRVNHYEQVAGALTKSAEFCRFSAKLLDRTCCFQDELFLAESRDSP
jgi:hypothetical protein